MLLANNSESFWCPNCCFATSGAIMRDGKRICIVCGRELWFCSVCKQKTFGTKENKNLCGSCKTGVRGD